MFTLITDRTLRCNLSYGDYISRLNILSSFGKYRIIVRDDHSTLCQIETLNEISELDRSKNIGNFELALSSDFGKFYRLKNKYMLDAIHMRQSDFESIKEIDLEKLASQGIKIGTSVHGFGEYNLSYRKKLNYILISPIFLTKCKMGVDEIEEVELNRILTMAKKDYIKVVALGGIGYTDISNTRVKNRYGKFSDFAIRSLFYESDDLKNDLNKIVEVAKGVD